MVIYNLHLKYLRKHSGHNALVSIPSDTTQLHALFVCYVLFALVQKIFYRAKVLEEEIRVILIRSRTPP